MLVNQMKWHCSLFWSDNKVELSHIIHPYQVNNQTYYMRRIMKSRKITKYEMIEVNRFWKCSGLLTIGATIQFNFKI